MSLSFYRANNMHVCAYKPVHPHSPTSFFVAGRHCIEQGCLSLFLVGKTEDRFPPDLAKKAIYSRTAESYLMYCIYTHSLEC